MTPAQRVILKFGSKGEVAKAAGVDVSRVHRWNYPKSKGGSDGRVPSKRQQRLLDYAREHGIDLSPADFFAEAAQ